MTDTPPVPALPAAARPKGWADLPAPTTRDVLAVLSTLLFAAACAAPWVFGIPEGAEQYIGQMQGAIIVQWASVMGWYFGSSKSSSQKDDTIAAMAKGDGQ